MAFGQSPEPSETASIDAALARYDELPAGSRDRFARELIVRLQRANAIVLSGDEAAAAQNRTEKFARLLERGYEPPRSSIRNLLTELTRREEQAVERLARDYRLQIYRTFRQKELVYRSRQAAWKEIEAAWRSADSPIGGRPQLIDWLVVATHRSTPGTIDRLPGLPDFSPQIGLPEALPSRIARHTRRPGPRLPDSILRPGIEPRRRTALPPAPDQPREDSPQAASSGDWVLGAVAEPEAVRTGSDAAARVNDHPRLASRSAAGFAPPVSVHRPQPTGLATSEVPDASDVASRVLVGPARESGGPAVDQPSPAADEPVFGDWLLAQPGERPERSESDTPPFTDLARSEPPVRRELETPTAAGTEPLPQPLVAADYPPGGRWPEFPDEPPATSARESLPPPASADTPASDRPSPAADGPSPAASVDLKELAAGIAGANLSLTALEAELDNDGPLPSARRIASLVGRLEILVLRHDDLALFCELITPEQVRQVGSLHSPRAVIPRVANKIYAIRTHVSGNDFQGTKADREFELELLGELSRKLAELAER